ncbi:unnamed protein product, partial [Strongylus vulgaris]
MKNRWPALPTIVRKAYQLHLPRISVQEKRRKLQAFVSANPDLREIRQTQQRIRLDISSQLDDGYSSSGSSSSCHFLIPMTSSRAFRCIHPENVLKGRCFNTEKGLSIEGGDYRRLRSIDHRGCAVECRDDPSCLAYEWGESDEVCYLKSRSLSGDLIKKKDCLIGFCLDE